MSYDGPREPGGIKGKYFIAYNDLRIHLFSQEVIDAMKSLVDHSPDEWLNHQLVNCLKAELYEVAAYIRDVARERGIDLSQ